MSNEIKSIFPMKISQFSKSDVFDFRDRKLFKARTRLNQRGLIYNGLDVKGGYRVSSDGNNFFIGPSSGFNNPKVREYIYSEDNEFAKTVLRFIPLYSEIGGRYFFKFHNGNRGAIFHRSSNKTLKEIFFWDLAENQCLKD